MVHGSVSPSLLARVRGLGRVWSCHCLRVAGDHLSLHSTQYCLHHLSPLLKEGGGKGERGREGREREGREREGGGKGRKEGEREGREGKREREGSGEGGGGGREERRQKEQGKKQGRNRVGIM